jgi:hypothetical protein
MEPMSPELMIFAGAGVITLIAFTALILVPAVGSFNRGWEKVTAVFLSLIVLIGLVGIGLAIGATIVYFWPEISQLLD